MAHAKAETALCVSVILLKVPGYELYLLICCVLAMTLLVRLLMFIVRDFNKRDNQVWKIFMLNVFSFRIIQNEEQLLISFHDLTNISTLKSNT